MITVIYSTITGNTKKVADAIYANIKEKKQIINIDEMNYKKIEQSTLIVLCYWCARGTADPKTLKVLERLNGYKIIAVGTLGTYVDSPHGLRMRERVKKHIEENNHFLGDFICRGKIAEERTERRRKLPTSHKHYLDDEGYKRHLSSRKHPTKEDLQNAENTVEKLLQEVYNG